MNKNGVRYSANSGITVKPQWPITSTQLLSWDWISWKQTKRKKRKSRITNWLLMGHEHGLFFYTFLFVYTYISVHLIKWPITGLLQAPSSPETAGAYTNIQFGAGAGINQAHVYTENKIEQIWNPTLATTLRKCALNNRSPPFQGPTSGAVLAMQLLHLSSAKVCRQGLLGGPLEEYEGVGEGWHQAQSPGASWARAQK